MKHSKRIAHQMRQAHRILELETELNIYAHALEFEKVANSMMSAELASLRYEVLVALAAVPQPNGQ